MRILIADDHTVVRRGIVEILSDAFPNASFGEARNAQEVLHAVQTEDWDVIVLDITMPGRSGLDALKRVRDVRPTLPVLILSMHPEDQFGVRCLKAGAAGYITKERAPDELTEAIRKVVSGGRYVSPTLADHLAVRVMKGWEGGPHELLSDREHQILCSIASGRTVSQIARELSLSVKTISTYRARVLQKMGMKTNAELTRYAIENQLVR